jgi:hypothetical protein
MDEETFQKANIMKTESEIGFDIKVQWLPYLPLLQD